MNERIIYHILFHGGMMDTVSLLYPEVYVTREEAETALEAIAVIEDSQLYSVGEFVRVRVDSPRPRGAGNGQSKR